MYIPKHGYFQNAWCYFLSWENDHILLILGSYKSTEKTAIGNFSALLWGSHRSIAHYRQPEIRNVYIFMGAKKREQPAMPIRPDFAQLAWILLDPKGQV